MGAKDRKPARQQRSQNRQDLEMQNNDEQSNETLPVPALEQLQLNQRKSNQTVAPTHLAYSDQFSFLKNKPIRKRNRPQQQVHKPKQNNYMAKLQKRIQELQSILQEYKAKENSCPHCHFYLNQLEHNKAGKKIFTPQPDFELQEYSNHSNSKDSLQFQQVNFRSPLMCNPEMQEKSWIFLGTIMIAMGSKVMDVDGTMNVFKVIKESVDRIRRQVEKSQERLNMDFFLSKEEFVQEMRMQELTFDPFFNREQNPGGLQLQGVRVESVQEYDLCFEQKLNFSVQYDALITVMQYLKENSSISYG